MAQLKAASTRLRMLQGEKLSFADEAEGLFGVRPEVRPLSTYDPVLARIEALVPGRGQLSERVEAFQQRFTIPTDRRSEEHTSELQSLMRTSYAVFCLKKKKKPP